MLCTTCNEEKTEDCFYLRKDTGKLRKECTPCLTQKRKGKYHKDPEKALALQKVSYTRNRDKRLSYQRNYYIKNKEKALLLGAKKRAEAHGIPFDITEEDIIIPENCPALGIPLAKDNSKLLDDSPSLDRFYPELGYIKGNVTVISNKANRMKNSGSIEDVKKLLKWMEQSDEF